MPLAWIQAVPDLIPDSLGARLRTDWEEFLGPTGRWALEIAARVAVVLLLAWLSYRLLGVLLRRVERSVDADAKGTVTLQEQRLRTLLSLLRSVGVTVIGLITLFMVLNAVGVDIGPLLAGAGVVGLAISFGAQSLVKDIISGLFILIENQFGVGDVVRIGDVSGTVEKMTLRIVVLRDAHGVVHIVPNGAITIASNLTRSFSRAVMDVGVDHREDVDRVIAVMRDVGREMWEDPQWRPLLIDEISVPGVESFAEASVSIRIVATTVPLKQWEVARELRRRIKKRFDAESIHLPFPHRTLFWGDGQMPGEREGTKESTP